MTDSRIPDLSAVASPPRRELDYRTIEVAHAPVDAGGQAVVYEATVPDDAPPDRIALKEPADDHGTVTGDIVHAFLDEASTWEMLDQHEREKPRWADSEHVVGIIDTGAQLPWIAMEYMDGGSLADRLNGTDGLPLDEALWIGECVCRGIELAHNYGVAHLDIKPANVLFRETGPDSWSVPKLADWGLARSLSEQNDTTNGLSVRYAAPEQFEPGEFGDPDMLTDVYQTGALVYALLTGRPPYVGNRMSVMDDVVSESPPSPPSSHRDDVPPAVDALVSIALETSKRDRYDAIQILRQSLHAARTDQPLPPTVADQVPSDPSSARSDAGGAPATGAGVTEPEGDTSRSAGPRDAGGRERDAPDTHPESDSTSDDTDAAAQPFEGHDGTSTVGEMETTERSGDDPDEAADERSFDAPAATDTGREADPKTDTGTTADSRFDPSDYPEARERDLAAAIRAIGDNDPATSLAEAIERLDRRSIADAVGEMEHLPDY